MVMEQPNQPVIEKDGQLAFLTESPESDNKNDTETSISSNEQLVNHEVQSSTRERGKEIISGVKENAKTFFGNVGSFVDKAKGFGNRIGSFVNNLGLTAAEKWKQDVQATERDAEGLVGAAVIKVEMIGSRAIEIGNAVSKHCDTADVRAAEKYVTLKDKTLEIVGNMKDKAAMKLITMVVNYEYRVNLGDEKTTAEGIQARANDAIAHIQSVANGAIARRLEAQTLLGTYIENRRNRIERGKQKAGKVKSNDPGNVLAA